MKNLTTHCQKIGFFHQYIIACCIVIVNETINQVQRISRALMKFKCEGYLFYLSNLFVRSLISATVGNIYWYSHYMCALPVIFSTIEPCSHGRQVIFHIEIQAQRSYLMSHQPLNYLKMTSTQHWKLKVAGKCGPVCVWLFFFFSHIHALLLWSGSYPPHA